MRKAFAIIFFILFIIIFPGSLFSFNLKQTVLSPVFYKNAFRTINFYNRLAKIDPQKVADYIGSKQSAESEGKIGSEQIGTILNILPPQDLQIFVEKNIDLYLASSSKGQAAAIDMTTVKKTISQRNSDPEIKQMISQIPDSYQPPQTTSRLNKYSRYFPISKILSYFGFGFSIFCLILSFLLWPGWKGKLRMSGTILIIFGAIIVIGNLILRPIPVPTNFVAEFLNGIARDLTMIAKNSLLRLYLIEGLSMLGAGFVFWVISFFVPGAPAVQKIAAPQSAAPKPEIKKSETPPPANPKSEEKKTETQPPADAKSEEKTVPPQTTTK